MSSLREKQYSEAKYSPVLRQFYEQRKGAELYIPLQSLLRLDYSEEN